MSKRLTVRAVMAAVAVAGGLLVPAGGAVADPTPPPGTEEPDLGGLLGGAIPLPPIGVDISHSMYAANTQIRLNDLGLLFADFKGGINLTTRSSGTEGITLEEQGFRMEADLNHADPSSGYRLVLERDQEQTGPLSTLTVADGGGVEMLIHIPMRVSYVDKATGKETVVGSTAPGRHATLRCADVKVFPAVNQPCSLRDPVTLLNAAGAERGALEIFDVLMNQSA
ncbi:hypothetical protein ACH4C6_28575 [Streptomyces sp. NPDC017943]|uniref:hypothetical protein n=1 Tax=Streptomyces sp. NPDC017943 TaxID=3365019 RepID=UPI003793F2C6